MQIFWPMYAVWMAQISQLASHLPTFTPHLEPTKSSPLLLYMVYNTLLWYNNQIVLWNTRNYPVCFVTLYPNFHYPPPWLFLASSNHYFWVQVDILASVEADLFCLSYLMKFSVSVKVFVLQVSCLWGNIKFKVMKISKV